MGRDIRHIRKRRLAAQARSNLTRQELGWYVRNCALSPAAGLLEGRMLDRLERLWVAVDNDESELEVAIHGKEHHRRRRLRELRRVLENYTDLPLRDESVEMNALFARDEFGTMIVSPFACSAPDFAIRINHMQRFNHDTLAS